MPRETNVYVLFTQPKISTPKNKPWFVWFRYLNEETGKKELIVKKGGANYKGMTKAERMAELTALKAAIKFKLQHQGWNPITNTYIKVPSEQEISLERLQEMNILEAMEYARKKKLPDWSKKTSQDYKSKIKYLGEAAVELGLGNFRITELRRLHYRNMLDQVRLTRGLSAAGYNIYRDYLSSLLGELEQDEILEYNPIHKIKTKETIKKIAHRPPTQDQRLTIVSRIKSDHRNYYRFLAVLYGCTIRPKEITALKIKHLHKLEQIFRLTPDNESSTKTKFERDVPIPDWVMDLLAEINLHKYPQDFYIFSSKNKLGSFLPGPARMHSNTPTKWWREIVKGTKGKPGLGMDVNQYSLKKLSGDDMVRLQRREGTDQLLELPKMMMGHTSKDMTEVYVREHKDVLKDLIKRKMPEL